MGHNRVSSQSRRRDNNVIRVRDAIIEEIFRDRNVGYVTISYGDMGEFNMIHVRVVTLLVGRDTTIENQFGQELLLRDLKEGMTVDAEFSSAMTASIPPQARAFRIVVLGDRKTVYTHVGRVIDVDVENSYLITGNARDINSQIRFNVNLGTAILDRRGRRIRLGDIRPGQKVRVEHASNMTFSIPPQTTAFSIQIVS